VLTGTSAHTISQSVSLSVSFQVPRFRNASRIVLRRHVLYLVGPFGPSLRFILLPGRCSTHSPRLDQQSQQSFEKSSNKEIGAPPPNGCTGSLQRTMDSNSFVGRGGAPVDTPLSNPDQMSSRRRLKAGRVEEGHRLVLWFSLRWTAAAEREAAGETCKSGTTTVKEATFTGAPPLFLRAGVKEGHSRRRRRVCSGGGCCSGLSWRSQYSSLVVPARG